MSKLNSADTGKARVKKVWGAVRGAKAGLGIAGAIGASITVPASAAGIAAAAPFALAGAGIVGGAYGGYKLAKYAGIIGGAVDGGIIDGAVEGYEQAKKLLED